MQICLVGLAGGFPLDENTSDTGEVTKFSWLLDNYQKRGRHEHDDHRGTQPVLESLFLLTSGRCREVTQSEDDDNSAKRLFLSLPSSSSSYPTTRVTVNENDGLGLDGGEGRG